MTAPTRRSARPSRPGFALAAAIGIAIAAAPWVATPARAACPEGMTPEEAEAASEVIPYQLMTPAGPILIGLLPGVAPETVAQFIAFAEGGYYDDTVFHNAWLDGSQELANLGLYYHVAIDTGVYRHTAEAGFEKIAFPPTTVPDETCLRNERGTVIALEPRTFDGAFEIYVRNPRDTWCKSGDPCFLDADYIVFARLIDDQGVPLDKTGDLGPADRIGEYLGLDGFLNLDDPVRGDLRRIPVNLDRDLKVEQQTTLSETAACFRTGELPVPFLALLPDGVGSVVKYDTGPDTGEIVVSTTPDELFLGDNACGDLITDLITANGGTSWLPETFACDPDNNPQRMVLWQTENRCGSASLDMNGQLDKFCFILNSLNPITFVESQADCRFLAASELMLDLRREELQPQLIPKLATVVVPEPQLGALGLAGFGSVVVLHRRRRRAR